MEHTTSADGTRIAYDTFGDGPPVVIVGGAMSTARDAIPLAQAFADAGLMGVTMDRRARGESGDTAPYAPEREAEDIAAVVGAIGGEAAVFGHSSGAVLAHFAAGVGVAMTHLFLSEPPYLFEGDPRDDGLAERLQELVDSGRGADAITTFQREAVGLDEAVIEQIRQSPFFAGLVPIAQSVVYDAVLTLALPAPTEAMLGVAMPVTIVLGETTFPVLMRAADDLAAAMPAAELVIDPQSSDHDMDPASIGRILRERL